MVYNSLHSSAWCITQIIKLDVIRKTKWSKIRSKYWTRHPATRTDKKKSISMPKCGQIYWVSVQNICCLRNIFAFVRKIKKKIYCNLRVHMYIIHDTKKSHLEVIRTSRWPWDAIWLQALCHHMFVNTHPLHQSWTKFSRKFWRNSDAVYPFALVILINQV